MNGPIVSKTKHIFFNLFLTLSLISIRQIRLLLRRLFSPLETYNIPFPLVPDGEFKLYKEIGVKRTPYFIAVKLMRDGKSKVFYSKPGGFESYKKFLEMIIRLSGLKCSK